MFSKILVLCIGNICRSPMAEILLKTYCEQSIDKPIKVQSAGIHALTGYPAAEHSCTLMQERGLDLSEHVAKKISPDLLNWADVILVMENEHKRMLDAYHPACRGKTFRLLESENVDISDPYRKPLEVFRASLELIDQGCKTWAQNLK